MSLKSVLSNLCLVQDVLRYHTASAERKIVTLMRLHIVIEYGKKYTSFKFLLVGPQNTKAPPGMFSGKLLNVLCFQYNSVAT